MNRFHRSLPRPIALVGVSTLLLLALACAEPLLAPQTRGPGGPFLPDQDVVRDELVVSGLVNPTAMAILPDGRVLVNEQCGTLRVVSNGTLLPGPMLTLSTSCTSEMGLLGIAIDPNFSTTARIYLYYTVPGPPAHNRISAFTVSGDQVVAGSESILFDLDNITAGNHNGGGMHFGPDGKLYVGVGDHGTPANAQSMTTVSGKMLRINSDGSIPADNPFAATATGNNRAIWALGLRNPYTFNFQPGTGRFFINDVGESTTEEVDEGVKGANYGWPTCEGPCSTSHPGLTDPFYSYSHLGGECGIIGASFYNPAFARLSSSWVGQYFFGDICTGHMWALDPSTRAVTLFAFTTGNLVDLAVSRDGYLYHLSHGSGQVYRIASETIAPQPVTASVTAANKAYNGSAAAKISACTLSGNPAGVTCSPAAASFATATAGSNRTVTATGITLGGANAIAYTLTSATATTTATINPLPVGAHIVAANKVFDGTTTATITSCTVSGNPAGASCAAPRASFASSSIGTNITVTASGLTLIGANAGNYVLTGASATTTAAIFSAASAVTATVTAAGKTYNGSAAAKINTCALTGNPAGVTCSATAAAFADPNAGAGKTVTATGITLGGPNAASYHLLSTSATTTATISKLSVGAHIVAQNKVFDGTSVATIRTCTVSANPPDVLCVAAEAHFPNPSVGFNKLVTATGLTLTGANSGNYVLTGTTATTRANILAQRAPPVAGGDGQ